MDTGQLKICKVSSEPTLQGVPFNFTYTGDGVSGSATLVPGACSALSGPIPVVDAAGNPFAITVAEAIPPGVDVSNIAVQNGTIGPYVNSARVLRWST